MSGIDNKVVFTSISQPRSSPSAETRTEDETAFNTALDEQKLVLGPNGKDQDVTPQGLDLIRSPLTNAMQASVPRMSANPVDANPMGIRSSGISPFGMDPVQAVMAEIASALLLLGFLAEIEKLVRFPQMMSSRDDGNPIERSNPYREPVAGMDEGEMSIMPVGDHAKNVSDSGQAQQSPQSDPATQGIRSAPDEWYLNEQGDLSDRQIANIEALISGKGEIALTTEPMENEADFVGGIYSFSEVEENLDAVADAPGALGSDTMRLLSALNAPDNAIEAARELFTLDGDEFKNAFLDLMRTPLGEILAPALERAVTGPFEVGEGQPGEAPVGFDPADFKNATGESAQPENSVIADLEEPSREFRLSDFLPITGDDSDFRLELETFGRDAA